jgi:hypothetical protein|tara:strand:+ start:51 stop:320 length:270 start_codon:yes stop_codon:yes gene_type:complete
MQTKQSAEQILAKAFVGKKFIDDEFHELDDILHNAYEEDVAPKKDIIGKVITDVEIVSYGYRECGIVLKFDEYNSSIFLHENNGITVED